MNTPFKIRRPKGLADYILKNCAKESYLIFDRKNDISVCTRCGAVKKISQTNDKEYLKHNVKHFCYECDTQVICKEWRYGRKNITDYGRILFLTKRGRDTYAQLDEYIINYDKMMKPSVDVCTIAQYKFNKEEQLYYKYNFRGYWSNPEWKKMKDIKIPAPYIGMFGQYSKFESTFFYEPSRSRIGTDLKYADLNMKRLGYNCKYSWESYILIGYIANFCKYPSIELLEKSGFENIVRDRAKGMGCSKINWRGKSLRKILKMNNGQIKECRKLNIGIKDVERIDIGKREFPERPIHESLILTKLMRTYGWDALKNEILEYLPLERASDYLLTQQGEVQMSFRDYADYLNECERLGMNLKDKAVLKPKNLQEAHTETSKRIKVESDAITQKNFSKFTLKITGMKEPYIYGDYMIRPAASPDELNKESKELAHCVRTYVDKVASGKTAILFIRKVSAPDKSLYTLELNKRHEVVQCRGLRNCDYPKKVQEFIDRWMKDVINKSKITAKAA